MHSPSLRRVGCSGFAAAWVLGALMCACSSGGGGGGADDLVEADADAAGDAAPDAADAEVGPTAEELRLHAWCGADWQAVEARIDALMAQMSLEQKVDQMAGVGSPGARNGWATPAISELGVPGLVMLDGPRGVSKVAGNATAFPVAVARAATFDAALEREVGAAMATEARAHGADTLLAPCINVLRHPRWGRSQETYGEDPWLLGEMGAAYVEGVQSRDVLAVVKHYAVNSIEDTRFDVDVTVDERTLREVYLPHFRRVVTGAHVAAVMSAYNLVNGTYCGENPHLLRDILKGEWGFVGPVMSDWLLGTRSTVDSALAGLDIEMPGALFYGSALVAAVEGGEVPVAVIDEAVRRILRAQLCFDLDSAPAQPDPSALETAATRALAREVATRAGVLLKNDGVLPLSLGAGASLVVVGSLAAAENIGDTGSSDVRPTDVVTVLEGFQAAAAEVGATVTHIAEYPFTDEAKAAIADADAVVVTAGLRSGDEGESSVGAGDRESLALPRDQPELIAATTALNPSAVVLLMGGGALTMDPWLDDAAAVLMLWYPGVEGGHAAADLVLGKANPSGRLPMVFSTSEADLPPFDNQSLEVTYGYWHGYRWLQHEGTAPLFPFGFGLSYTTFSYDAVRVDSAGLAADPPTFSVEVDLTNTGARDGIEVVQLYLEPPAGALERPERLLVGAAPVSVAAGASATARFEVPRHALAIYDVAASGWTVPGGTYGLVAAPHADAAPLTATLQVTAAQEAP
ncbi:MAG: glycoside hydrolase family 3 C-terminal domain-containing protein [Deltaproteobacteria bacterium]|nr:glycoside hydrolase family 3 C-terminal domain-containing protein [Deltaproteobacteria bacterium]